MTEDAWSPSDDPDYWDEDGRQHGHENESHLRWRIVTPDGRQIDSAGDDRPMRTRRDAIANAAAPHLDMATATMHRLMDLSHQIAGWSKIEADGWIIEPIQRAGKP